MQRCGSGRARRADPAGPAARGGGDAGSRWPERRDWTPSSCLRRPAPPNGSSWSPNCPRASSIMSPSPALPAPGPEACRHRSGIRSKRSRKPRTSRSRSGSASRRPDQAAQVAGWGADGVIVGSALVKVIEENAGSPELVGKAAAFVKALKQGVLAGHGEPQHLDRAVQQRKKPLDARHRAAPRRSRPAARGSGHRIACQAVKKSFALSKGNPSAGRLPQDRSRLRRIHPAPGIYQSRFRAPGICRREDREGSYPKAGRQMTNKYRIMDLKRELRHVFSLGFATWNLIIPYKGVNNE